MALLVRFSLLGAALASCGCQLSYYLHGAYHQTKLLQDRVSIERALKSKNLGDEQKRKLQLVQEVREFIANDLGLKVGRNYSTYVQLEGPYVTYIVQAAYPFELKSYLWKFPFVGEVPYKGYFRKALADEEADELRARHLDTYVRGVSAYSTLGWFHDSVLSSMLRYDDYDLVETIIHETVHANLFVKSAVDFNERLATFLGRKGMILFYNKKEGADSPTVKLAAKSVVDQNLFSSFLTREVEELKAWYTSHQGELTQEQKDQRLKEMQVRFNKDIKPAMQTKDYEDFGKRELNNAVLLAYRTYEYNLDDFEKVWKRFQGNFQEAFQFFKTLEKEKDPASKL
ncbi:MAG: aminopeptidase [Bdellovibrionales bacterium]